MLLELGEAVSAARALTRETSQTVGRLDDDDEPLRLDALDPDVEAELRDLAREAGELENRLGRLQGSAQGWIGPLSADQASQRAFLTAMLETLRAEWNAVSGRLGR